MAVGTVVQIAVDDVDRAKVDDHNLTLVVVELVEKGTAQKDIKYRLAGTAGVLKTLYMRSYIKPLPTATPTLMGLQSVLDGWRELPQDVSIRTLAKSTSQAGGQGVVRCDCKGACDKNSCSCFKRPAASATRVATSPIASAKTTIRLCSTVWQLQCNGDGREGLRGGGQRRKLQMAPWFCKMMRASLQNRRVANVQVCRGGILQSSFPFCKLVRT